MILNTLHFEGSMEDLGVAYAEEYDELFQRRLRGLQQHSMSVGSYFKPFMDSMEETTEIGRANLGGIMEQAKYEPGGAVECVGGKMLAARYRFKPSDIVQVFHGELDGRPFFFMSLFPQLPGTLCGMGRSGIAWARRVPERYTFETGDGCQVVEYGASDWGKITALMLKTGATSMSAPHPHGLIKNLPGYCHKGEPTSEQYARDKFEDAHDPEDVLVLLDSPTREVTIIRGNGFEVTYDILAQD